MGALADAWKVRLSTQQQVNLTNPDVESASSVNATVLGAAETDASNAFYHKTGVTFDSTNSEHITVAIPGVTYFLYSYRGMPKSAAAEAARDDWDKATAAFARTRGALAWITPTTDSNLLPSTDDANALPYFDRKVLADIVPNQPMIGNSDPLDYNRSAP